MSAAALAPTGTLRAVINTGNELCGENTDWRGIVRALAETERSFAGGSALVVGAGGAAAAAVFALKALNFGTIAVTNRTAARADELAKAQGVGALPYAELGRVSADSLTLLVNATPIGSHLAADADFGFDFSSRQPAEVVFDMVTRETPLIVHSRTAGAKVVSGLRMLLHQAADQFQLFSELVAPLDEMERALYGQAGQTLPLPARERAVLKSPQ